MKLLLISFVLLAIGFAGIAIKIWAKKDGKFAGTCASQSPFLNKEGEACSMCGKMPYEQECKNPQSQKNN
ncbi:membrane or secreted protein [Abyssalbus ytuae]|uniref:Membrane or secreted protein n=1 Tax=Abyssalbus ytuae TaxID=2926907 RepID=A0A9E6ZWK8_9FLAO|nr:membrane or secreted protein [Abyssalbus ytuae]UOB18136.1 membrane or secreted protein [Abyssalbus ytuae]